MYQLFCVKLFVPSVGVFGITEIISFHLQLSGSIHSIQELLLQPNLERRPHSQAIRVYLLRQIKVDAIGKGTTKINTILGEGSFRCLPPVFQELPSSHSSTFKNTINWEGELQLQDFTTPTFDAGTFGVMVSA